MNEHDYFHPPTQDPWWFESFWFSFVIPEKKVIGYVYPWFRPTMGVCGGGVLFWDDSGKYPWEIPHFDYAWHRPMPSFKEMFDGNRLTLPQGIRIEIVKPLSCYKIEYRKNDLELDLLFEAVTDAEVSTEQTGKSNLFAGRIDQIGHVTGELSFRGETTPIDCYSMRDRSWGVRTEFNLNMHIGYYHAHHSPNEGFLALTDATREVDSSSPVTGGYLLRDGLQQPLVGGSANVIRNANGTIQHITITATDSGGRTLNSEAKQITLFGYQPQAGMFNWSSLAKWTFGGVEAHGEIQDTWHPQGWRRFITAFRSQTSERPHAGS